MKRPFEGLVTVSSLITLTLRLPAQKLVDWRYFGHCFKVIADGGRSYHTTLDRYPGRPLGLCVGKLTSGGPGAPRRWALQ